MEYVLEGSAPLRLSKVNTEEKIFICYSAIASTYSKNKIKYLFGFFWSELILFDFQILIAQ